MNKKNEQKEIWWKILIFIFLVSIMAWRGVEEYGMPENPFAKTPTITLTATRVPTATQEPTPTDAPATKTPMSIDITEDWVENCYAWHNWEGNGKWVFVCYDHPKHNAPCLMKFQFIPTWQGSTEEETVLAFYVDAVCKTDN